MQFLGHFCILVFVCSVFELYKRILQVFLMDFSSCLKFLTQNSELKRGFVLFGCFEHVVSVLSLFLMFGLGLKYLQIAWHGKGLIQFLLEIRGKTGDTRIGFCSEKDFDQEFDKKIVPFDDPSSLKVLNLHSNSAGFDVSDSDSDNDSRIGVRLEKDFDQELDEKIVPFDPSSLKNLKIDTNVSDFDDSDSDIDYETKFHLEDEECDLIVLRRLVKIERQRAEMATLELEKERMASESSANEAMAMILRLQREKSSVEIEANQFRRLVEQIQGYDHEVIQSLQLIVMKFESERFVFEEKLRVCKEKLKEFMKSDEFEQFERILDVDTAIEDVHTVSL